MIIEDKERKSLFDSEQNINQRSESVSVFAMEFVQQTQVFNLLIAEDRSFPIPKVCPRIDRNNYVCDANKKSYLHMVTRLPARFLYFSNTISGHPKGSVKIQMHTSIRHLKKKM